MASFFLFLDKSAGKQADQHNWPRDGSFTHSKSGRYIASDTRLDYRQELAGKLGINLTAEEDHSDGELILLAYSKWGEECLAHLYGDFSFVIWDPRRDEIFCARDHFGCKPFYYLDRPGFLAVASKITAFKGIPGFSYEIDQQYILDALCTIVRSDGSSAYKGIRRLEPAHRLTFTQGKSSGQIPYWDLRIKDDYQGLTLEEATLELKERFMEAVRQRCLGPGPFGVELSGGLDSSGVASVLTMLKGEKAPIHAFTHSLSSEGSASHLYSKNEMEFSTILAEKYRTISHFEIGEEHDKGGFNSLTKALSCLHKPINLHYAVNSDLLFERAEKLGIAVMFSGFGGDEGISNQGNGYWNELISTGQHAKLRKDVRSMVNRHGGGFVKRLIRLYINYYAPWIFIPFREDWRSKMYRSFAIEKSLARKYRMRRRFFRSNPPPARPDIRAMQYFRLMYPNIPARMEETALLAEAHGLEYRYPFLDVRLVEFFYSLPSEYKYKDGTGRYLFRRAMMGILPDRIRLRRDKSGNTIPNAFVRAYMDRELFQEMIDESRLKNQCHYVDYDRLQAMLDLLQNEKAFKEESFDLRAFQGAMSVLILQRWQREGKIDIGIKV